MSNEKNSKKLVEEITPRDTDFAQWYTDIVKKAELMDYSSVRGCMIMEPYGYAIWENITKILDQKFKETGHENISMPMFIPESLLQKEKDHIEGFAPEVAWVTHGGSQELQERLCVRPTSETLFCEHYAKKIHSWRDLPKLYNQWCSVVRWEKTTRPFLRSVEFHWQEGHTVHATELEAMQETQNMQKLYADFCEKTLDMPVIQGQKTESEKFAGAEFTYTVEAMMYDGKALQSATSHYFGDKFARAFDITFQDKNNNTQYAYQTSWGISTRIIGGIIMTHGDDRGLVLPPDIAPVQVMIIPIAMHKAGVSEKSLEIQEKLNKICRVKTDFTDKSPGWKFAEHEMRGVPIRLEIGPKDIENNQCVLVRRDNFEKITVNLDTLEENIIKTLKEIKNNMYQKALDNLNSKIYIAKNKQEFNDITKNKTGFIKAHWCGSPECEQEIKNNTNFTSRCIIKDTENCTCVNCNKKSKHEVYWAKSY
ncbi:MAG: proline--tRNA ligase [Clostridia bacterium]|nr:proline--tRNA ligase [Clostridia bacterium]